MVKINLEIKKKDLWLVSAIFVFILGIGLVIGFGSNSPTIMGHDFGEIDGLQNALNAKQAKITGSCPPGQSIRVIDPITGGVSCEFDNSGSGTDTTCATSGTCGQVCIGTNCKGAWEGAICEWQSRRYSTGSVCMIQGYCKYCNINGHWADCTIHHHTDGNSC
jgi:hypothetical protein